MLGGFWVGLVGLVGEWAVGQWIVGVMSFQKMYGLYGKIHKISGYVTDAGRTNNNKGR